MPYASQIFRQSNKVPFQSFFHSQLSAIDLVAVQLFIDLYQNLQFFGRKSIEVFGMKSKVHGGGAKF